jgi:hypothetical protein
MSYSNVLAHSYHRALRAYGQEKTLRASRRSGGVPACEV